MKKTVVLFLLITLTTGAVYCEEERYIPNEPRWEEFAPAEYVNPKVKNYVATGFEEGIGIILTATIIGLPIGYPLCMHAQKRRMDTYWAGRKMNFESSVQYCKQFTNKKDIRHCFQDVRNNELIKNSDRGQVGIVRKNIKSFE